MPGRKHGPRTATPSAAYTIQEFCDAYRISTGFYYKLRDSGRGPKEMRLGKRILISVEAAQAWRRAQER